MSDKPHPKFNLKSKLIKINLPPNSTIPSNVDVNEIPPIPSSLINEDPPTTVLSILNTKTIPVDFDSFTDSKKIVVNITVNIVSDLLKCISKDFSVNLDELKAHYLSEFTDNKYYGILIDTLMTVDRQEMLKIYSKKQHPIVGNISNVSNIPIAGISNIAGISGVSSDPTEPQPINHAKCYAKTAKLIQCSRKKKSADSRFCGGHETKQPYGCVDDEVPFKAPEKKRGRPPKTDDQKTKSKSISNVQSPIYSQQTSPRSISPLQSNPVISKDNSNECNDLDNFDTIDIDSVIYALYIPSGNLYPTAIDEDGDHALIPNSKPVGKKNDTGGYNIY